MSRVWREFGAPQCGSARTASRIGFVSIVSPAHGSTFVASEFAPMRQPMGCTSSRSRVAPRSSKSALPPPRRAMSCVDKCACASGRRALRSRASCVVVCPPPSARYRVKYTVISSLVARTRPGVASRHPARPLPRSPGSAKGGAPSGRRMKDIVSPSLSPPPPLPLLPPFTSLIGSNVSSCTWTPRVSMTETTRRSCRRPSSASSSCAQH